MTKRKIQINDLQDILLDSAYELFIDKQKVRNNSEETIKSYRIHILRFIKYLAERDIIHTQEITGTVIDGFILYCKKQNPNLKSVSINTKIRSIRAFCYFLMEEGYIKPFPISTIKAKKDIKELYSDEDIIKLLEKPVLEKDGFACYRNWVIINYLLGTGNRSRSIRNIKIKNVDLNKRCVRLEETKNKEVQIVPLNDELYPTIKEYMRIRGGDPDDYLFCTQFNGMFSQKGFADAVRYYCEFRNVNYLGVHTFRHLFAKTWILEGGSTSTLQTALGHETPTMVNEYVHLYGHEITQEYNSNTLLSKLKQTPTKKKIKTYK